MRDWDMQVGKISSVRTEVQATGKKVAQAATAFARLAFLQKGSGGALNQAAGLVFERCDSAAKLQTENRAAVSSSLMKASHAPIRNSSQYRHYP